MVLLDFLKPEDKFFKKVFQCKDCCSCMANLRQPSFDAKAVMIFRKPLEFVLSEENARFYTASQIGHSKTETI